MDPLLSEFDEGVEDENAVAFALFLIELFFMLAWLVDPGASPLPSQFGATASNFAVVNAFIPLLIVIVPVTIFGILQNMFTPSDARMKQAFALTPRILVQVQSRAAGLTARTQHKRAYYKRYGRGLRYHEPKPKPETEE